MINFGDEDIPFRPIPTSRPQQQQQQQQQPTSFQSPSKINDHGSVEFSPQKAEGKRDVEQDKMFNDASHWSETHEEDLPELE